MKASLPAILALLILAPTSMLAQQGGAHSGRLLVAQKGLASLAIVDPTSGKVIASIYEDGITGHEVIASSDGRFAYVPIYGNSGVGLPGTDGSNMVVIDLHQKKLIGNVNFGHGVRPHQPVLNPHNGLLYVTTELDRAVTIIDPKTLSIVGNIPTGQAESHMLAISHNGLRGYTANVGPGTVSVLDIPARKTITIIPVASQIQRISISPDDKWVFTSDQTKPQLAVIDTATNKVAKWIPLAGTGYGTAPTADGRWLLIALPETNKVAVVDLKEMKVAQNIEVPSSPQEVLIRPNGKVAYVSCNGTDVVVEINLADWKVARQFKIGKTTDGIAWAKAN